MEIKMFGIEPEIKILSLGVTTTLHLYRKNIEGHPFAIGGTKGTGASGFEPEMKVLETCVLPLHHAPMEDAIGKLFPMAKANFAFA